MFAVLHISTWWLIVCIGGGRVSVWLSRLNLQDVQILNNIVTIISLYFSKNSTQQLSHTKKKRHHDISNTYIYGYTNDCRKLSRHKMWSQLASLHLQMCPGPTVPSHQMRALQENKKINYIPQKRTDPKHTGIESLVYC